MEAGDAHVVDAVDLGPVEGGCHRGLLGHRHVRGSRRDDRNAPGQRIGRRHLQGQASGCVVEFRRRIAGFHPAVNFGDGPRHEHVLAAVCDARDDRLDLLRRLSLPEHCFRKTTP
jgi:ribosomal protein L27